MKKKSVFIVLLAMTLSLIVISGGVFAEDDEGEDHGGDIYYTKPVKAVIFSHKAHTEDIGLQCDWCHEETFEMEALNMQESVDFDMVSLCNERYCGTCHNGDISFSTTTQCARCHIGVKGYNELVKQGIIEPDEEETETETEHKE
ncbi:c(7)-type cytochrome triheme domain-containing protein [Thermodesulfobacteriota bacterium]